MSISNPKSILSKLYFKWTFINVQPTAQFKVPSAEALAKLSQTPRHVQFR